MATKKSGGSTRLGRDSQPKYLGVKKYDGETVKTSEVIIRQRGTKFKAGKNVGTAKDDTLFALSSGVVKFSTKRMTKFDGSQRVVKIVNVLPK